METLHSDSTHNSLRKVSKKIFLGLLNKGEYQRKYKRTNGFIKPNLIELRALLNQIR